MWAVLALLLAVCLLATARPASAAAAAATLHGTFVDYLDDNQPPTYGPDGTEYWDDWTALGVWTSTTGPEGGRFLGYVVMCLDLVIPPRGNNYHTGDIVFTTQDPRPWNTDRPFLANLPDEKTWLWKGTWDGVTLNKRNHVIHLDLTGYGTNSGLKAKVTWFMNLWTNANAVAFVTPIASP